MDINIYDFYNKMEQDKIMLSFKGNVTSELLTSVFQIMESKMEKLNEPNRIKKKVYNILVEALQNLYHHLEKQPDSAPQGHNTVIFMIGKKEEDYTIFTGNYITNDNADKLKTRLEKINSLDPEELKTYYKEVLNNGMMSDKGGGGLGMIDIARKSGKKLDFDFHKMDDEYSFYSLNINIPQ
ncbi:SiaB family protein kinase [Vicingaceae bacterium]|nr:SiaB family protein kinase [Vicingaceae bacterium]MDB4083126.1 SiaB family protein kinase [Vicingaceae bacterium]MDC1451544.1 SiaB family protein kinase [Vicingaceae bacterium]